MIAKALYNHPRMLFLAVGVIVVAGLSSFYVLPRMEDPVLGKRVGLVSTVFPGADAERVETLVTEKLEESLRDVAEIKEIQSSSRAGISNIVVELRDEVSDVEPVWSRVTDRLDQARANLPAGAQVPYFEKLPLKACAVIVAIKWEQDGPPHEGMLQRIAEDLKLRLRGIDGTEDVRMYGEPEEEVLVEIDAVTLASLGLSIGGVATQLKDSDAKQPAGLLRGAESELILDVDSQLDSLTSLGETQIRYSDQGGFVSLGDIASISKGTTTPPAQLALVDDSSAVVLGAFVRDTHRIDHWSQQVHRVLEDFKAEMPAGIGCEVILSQAEYVDARLSQLMLNLLIGTLAVVAVIFVLMGWRSTIIMSVALPLSALMVLAGMRFFQIPIHQMSVTGLIIALGLLIDNVIVMVDEVRRKIWEGVPPAQALTAVVRHLAIPLFGSTLTTTLAFAPIVMLPGPPGEFVGAIAMSVILAINSSFILAMTVVPAMTALLNRPFQGRARRKTVWDYGLSNRWLTRAYEGSLDAVFRSPWLGVGLGAVLPVMGLIVASTLPEQFFPSADRNQIHVEIEMPSSAVVSDTREIALAMREDMLAEGSVRRAYWFLGQSAPTFYYNLVPRRRSAPYYGQAILELDSRDDVRPIVNRLQTRLAERYPQCRVLVRELEQGPPYDAPIEIRLRGPDLATLQALGSELRSQLSRTSNVIATRSDLQETVPKLSILVDDSEAQLAGLSQGEIARQLYASLEGMDGGTFLDGSHELPIRVRLANRESLSLAELAALQLKSRRQGPPPRGPGGRPQNASPPRDASLAAIAQLRLDSEVASIPRLDGQRMNEVKAYLRAGTLPAVAIEEFEKNLADSGFVLPAGYEMSYAGEAAKRDNAVRDLLANAAILFSLMLVVLVLAFLSFRIAFIISAVGGLSIGLGVGALWVFGYPFGFMAIVGTMGLVGVAINDAIVVTAAIRSHPLARQGEIQALKRVVVGCTRHVVATTLTTIAGFLPLVLSGGRFWPPLATTIAGGVGGATLLALYLVPSLYLLLMCRGLPASVEVETATRASRPDRAFHGATADGV